MRLSRLILSLLAFVPGCFAQLTPAQKTADFMQLVGLYAKNYGPYELRRDLFGFDLYNVQPWLDQINKSKDDISFYDILTRYVASLQDSHDEFTTLTDFEAWLHMDTDLYDGKVLIGDIDRTYLPRNKYPFQVGDEVVSVDGTAAADLVQSFIPYAVNGGGNKTSQQRLAAGTIMDRVQSWYPMAAQVGDNATVVVKRQNGNVETYTIPWDKTGTPIVQVGPVPSPHAGAASAGIRQSGPAKLGVAGRHHAPQSRLNSWGLWQGEPAFIPPDPVPDYMQTLLKLQYGQAAAPLVPVSAGIFPFDNPAPVFNPPPGFKLRLGSKSTDQFVSGTFPVGNHTVGYIRIYTMAPTNTTTALTQFYNEVLFMQQTTDGLVIDVMGNGGGNGCYPQRLEAALIPYTFRGLGQVIRATQNWVADFSSALYSAKASGSPQWVIDLYTSYLSSVQQALSQNRGDTGTLPICGASFDVTPLADQNGNVIAYTKPILVLTDNFTLSAAEIFAMQMQDSKRAILFGTRTDGGGGNVVSYNGTNYSEGQARVTLGLITRAQPVATPGFPPGPYSIYYDGQGIYPDTVEDYQTLDNLLNGGATFVADFSTAIANMINAGH
ncbi:MAG TPA: S41 family peptidase [Bryobacteraceae bacterium]|nr:S41 family peptidase [Bryobacteraceae bacterium]